MQRGWAQDSDVTDPLFGRDRPKSISPLGGRKVMDSKSTRVSLNLVIGIVLVGLGVLFLLGQFFSFNLIDYLWPFFVIIPGLLFFVGMMMGGKKTVGLAIPGSIITMTGFILLYGNLSNHWESWAYAWALICPTSVGIGLMVQGRRSSNDKLFQRGRDLVKVGLLIFVIAGVFFELILNIRGSRVTGILGPLLLVALGVFLLLRRGSFWIGQGKGVKVEEESSDSPETTSVEKSEAAGEDEKN